MDDLEALVGDPEVDANGDLTSGLVYVSSRPMSRRRKPSLTPCAQTNVELHIPVDLSDAPVDLIHSVVDWLYSQCFPSFLLEHQPRYETDDDDLLPDLTRPLDMDSTYNDNWIMEQIRAVISNNVRLCREGAESGCRYRSLFQWAHDRAAVSRILAQCSGTSGEKVSDC